MKTLTRSLLLAATLIATFTLHAQEADLVVTKSGPAEAAADTDVEYIVILENLGPDAAALVELTDNIPAGTTFVSATQMNGPAFSCSTPTPGDSVGTITCSQAVFAAGASAEFRFVFHIDPTATPGTFITNVAQVTSPTDLNDENNTASATTTIPFPPQADLTVSKTGPSAAGPNQDIEFTIVVQNLGPDAARNVTLTDVLPGTMTFVSFTQNSGPTMSCTTPAVGSGGTISCNIDPFADGATAEFTLIAHTPPGAIVGTTYQNTASVSASNDTNEENNTSTANVIISVADIGVTKDGPANATAGDQIAYTIVVSNIGPDEALTVTMSDVLPPNTTFVSILQNNGHPFTCDTPVVGEPGSVVCDTVGMPSQAQAQFTLTVEIGNATSITNTASVATGSLDQQPANDEDSVVTIVAPLADVAVTKSGPATVTAGTNITYEVTVTNNGPSPAANVSLTDTLPPSTTFVSLTQNSGPAFTCTTSPSIDCSIASLAPLATATFTIVAQVAANVPAGATLGNMASVDTTTPDSNTANDTSTTTATVATSADLAITKTGPAAAASNTDVAYTINVTNNGPSDAANVTMTDVIPPNTTFVSITPSAGCTGTTTVTCNLGTLAAGATQPFTLVVHIVAGTPNGTVISNTATVDSTTADPNGANDAATANTNVNATADVTVTKTGPASASNNTNIIYTVSVTNAGPSEALSVTLTDVIPPDTTFVSASQTSGPTFTCTTPPAGGTGTIECTIATFAANATATFQFVVHVNPEASGTIENTASVASPSDPTPGNNASTTAAAVGAAGIPTLSPFMLALLAVALAAIVVMKR